MKIDNGENIIYINRLFSRASDSIYTANLRSLKKILRTYLSTPFSSKNGPYGYLGEVKTKDNRATTSWSAYKTNTGLVIGCRRYKYDVVQEACKKLL